MNLVKAEDLQLFRCYSLADPVVGFNGYCNEVIVLGKGEETVTVCSPLNHKDVWEVSKVCLFCEIEEK